MTMPGRAVWIVTVTWLDQRSISTRTIPASLETPVTAFRIAISSWSRSAYCGERRAYHFDCQSFVTPSRKPIGCTFWPTLALPHYDRQVTRPFANGSDPPTRRRTEALQRRPFVGVNRRHAQPGGRQLVVVLRVGQRRAQRLRHLTRTGLRGITQDRQSLGRWLLLDELQQRPHFAGREAQVPGLRAYVHGPYRRLCCATLVACSVRPVWPRNVRVGANSPRRWPTICSVIKIGTCRRPSCTPMVKPTICGRMVEARDHVRINARWPLRVIASIFFMRCGATNGPFLRDRDTLFSLLRYIPQPMNAASR